MKINSLYHIYQDKWKKYSSAWIISDTHFGEDDLKEAFPNRPTDETLVKTINASAGRNDVLIHLGDVGDVEYVRKLRAAHKILIMGNHDKGVSNYKRQIVYEEYDEDKYTLDEVKALAEEKYPDWKINISKSYSFHAPFCCWLVRADNMLFDEVYEGPLMLGEKLILSHEPVIIPWAFNIHGHNHNDFLEDDYHYNVNIEMRDYKPTNLNKLMREGVTSDVPTLHRLTINGAIRRKESSK